MLTINLIFGLIFGNKLVYLCCHSLVQSPAFAIVIIHDHVYYTTVKMTLKVDINVHGMSFEPQGN